MGVHSAHAIAAYLIVAPIAAMLSAIFPRPVDLNSIGRGSNAHGAAGLLGMLAFLAAAAPGTLLISLVVGVCSGRPGLAAVLLLVWTAICLGISLVLFRLAALFERRRENLGLTVARPV